MKKEILKRISDEESKLHDEDASGHIWWNKFREFIESIPEPSRKLKAKWTPELATELEIKNRNNDLISEECGNCASDYYRFKDEEKHKRSGMYLCSRCASQW